MSKVYADAITTTEASQDLTLGGSGDNVIVTAGATLKTNTVKDSGGNTLWTSDGSGTLSSVNAAMKGNMVLLSSQTASNSASLSFTSSITGAFTTYKLYIFKFIEINPATDLAEFSFQGSINAGSSYGVTITSSAGHTYGHESSGATGLEYQSTNDLAQGTGFQHFCNGLGNGADESLSGEFHLFNPASTTFAKQWFARCQLYQASDYSEEFNTAGYFNDTNNIDAIQFKMDSGNFDGTIKMYGLG